MRIPIRRVCLLLAAPVLAAASCAEDPVPGLEARKQEILAATVEKQEFWAEVSAKGETQKKLRAIEREAAALAAQRAPLEARVAQQEAALADARAVNERAAELVGQAEAQREAAQAQLAELERTLARWSGGGS